MHALACAPAPHPSRADAVSVGLLVDARSLVCFSPSAPALKEYTPGYDAGVRAGAIVEKCVRCVSRTLPKWDSALKRKVKSPPRPIADPSAIRQPSVSMRQPSEIDPSGRGPRARRRAPRWVKIESGPRR